MAVNTYLNGKVSELQEAVDQEHAEEKSRTQTNSKLNQPALFLIGREGS